MSSGPIILTGASGLLGSTFACGLGGPLVCLGRDSLDPAIPGEVIRQVAALRPSLVINCAADTDVEGAEVAPERAFAVNATLAEALARGAAESGAPLVHFSSTGCYGEAKVQPYTETDPLRPTTVHHRSKAEGEVRVLAAYRRALVLRLGWVFGGVPGQRRNFVWARLMEAKGKMEIGSNPVQMGCPTGAADVVAQTLALLATDSVGVFNVVGTGAPASRFDYVSAILAASDSTTRIVPVKFTRHAPVAANESAVNARLDALGLAIMPFWRDSLAAYVRSLVPEVHA